MYLCWCACRLRSVGTHGEHHWVEDVAVEGYVEVGSELLLTGDLGDGVVVVATVLGHDLGLAHVARLLSFAIGLDFLEGVNPAPAAWHPAGIVVALRAEFVIGKGEFAGEDRHFEPRPEHAGVEVLDQVVLNYAPVLPVLQQT